MKRPISPPPADDDSKRPRLREGSDDRNADSEFGNLDENVLFEVLKHADARTLARCACVSKTWNRTSHDERLWEIVCTRHWPNVGCGDKQLRSVVLALGGFRRLYSLYLPLSKHPSGSGSGSGSGSSSSSLGSAWAPLAPPMTTRWGKDEVHLFLSLLSIRCYEKMNFSSRGR